MGFRWIEKGRPAVVLAPMEGVTDFPMRQWMGERGGFSYAVSEFLRITQYVPPSHTFFSHVPELKTGSRTLSGLAVQVQLLGGDAELLAGSAAKAVELGAPAIDLNFGCPAPTVNRHDGGATLLKYPCRIRDIVEAVRKAVPAHIPVSAKLRLGFDRMDSIHENAERAAEGGASWITIHGRTKVQGYMPPAYWGPIGEVNRRLGIPVVANGDLWTIEDLRRCRDETGCEHFMLGRSAMANPNLARQVSKELGVGAWTEQECLPVSSGLQDWAPLVDRFVEISLPITEHPRYCLNRVKQWVRMAHVRGAVPWFDELKKHTDLNQALRYFAEGSGGSFLGDPTMYVTHA
jgi:tRNA-dihydrouridine synthase C